MAKWPGNLDGAYTIIHDDLAPWVSSLYVTAGPELDAVGLDAAFGVIVEGVSGENIWSEVQELKDAGHEIINHSWTHADLSADGADLGLEMDSSHAEINTNLTSQSTTFFIFPYDAANQIGLDRLKGLGYLGARAGERGGLNGPDWADDFRLNFDVWGPGESMYEELGPCADESGSDPSDFTEECRHYVLNQYVDDTLAMNGWGIREFHGVEDNSWQSVSLADYQQHLTYVKAKVDAGALWVATPSRVIHYRRAREACQPTVTEQQIVFGTPTAACTTHLAPFQTLTLIVVANESMPTSMTVTQNGVSIPTTSLGSGRFQLEINPTAGDATISAL